MHFPGPESWCCRDSHPRCRMRLRVKPLVRPNPLDGKLFLICALLMFNKCHQKKNSISHCLSFMNACIKFYSPCLIVG